MISEYSECKPYDLTPLSSYNSFYLDIQSSLENLEEKFLLECSKLVESRNIHSNYNKMVLKKIDSYSNALEFMKDNFRSEFIISKSNYESEYNKTLNSYCKNILLFSILGKVDNQISEKASLCFQQYVDEMSYDLQKIKDLSEVLAIHYEKCKEFIVSSERDLLRQYDNSRLNDDAEIPLDIIDSKTDAKFLEYYNEFERIELESQIYKDKYKQGKYSDITDIINEVNYEGDVNRYKLLSLHTGIRSSINDLCSPIEGGISDFQKLFKSYCERKTQFAQARAARLLINFENRVIDPDADTNMDINLENNLAVRGNSLGPNVLFQNQNQNQNQDQNNFNILKKNKNAIYGFAASPLIGGIVLGACFAATSWGLPLVIGSAVALFSLAAHYVSSEKNKNKNKNNSNFFNRVVGPLFSCEIIPQPNQANNAVEGVI